MRTIQTAFGPKKIIRQIGVYLYEAPGPNAPNGGWWTLNQQHGYVPVSSNGRALVAALAECS